MKKYFEENRFAEPMRFEDNKGRTWGSDDLAAFSIGELEEMELHVSED